MLLPSIIAIGKKLERKGQRKN